MFPLKLSGALVIVCAPEGRHGYIAKKSKCGYRTQSGINWVYGDSFQKSLEFASQRLL